MNKTVKYNIEKERFSKPQIASYHGYIKDLATEYYVSTEQKRREFGEHLTSVDIFKDFIFPEIKNILYDYTWIDLFAGEGNLILPILEALPRNKREKFFDEHILLFDVQKEMIEKCIEKAKSYGIPYDLARKNIKVRDTLANYPDFSQLKYPPYHITNPPYLYLGYIVKNSERNLKYFTGQNEGYLYQIALINDLRNNIEKIFFFHHLTNIIKNYE